MTFNILNIGFSGDVASTFADRSNYVSDGDNNDIFYYIGTNFGASSWSNPALSPYLNLSTTGTISGGTVNLVTDNSDSAIRGSSNTNVAVIAEFTNAVFNFSRLDVQFFSNANGENIRVLNIFFDVSSDGVVWENITDFGDLPTFIGYQWENLFQGVNEKFYSFLRIRFRTGVNANASGLSEIKLYGSLKRTDGGTASRISLPQTIDQLPDVNIDSPLDGDYLYWNGGVVKHQREKLYETVRTTDNVILEDDQYLPNFYIITPSVTRTVDLPPNPVAGQFFRIRNLNNVNEVQINEPGPTLLTTIGGAGGPGLTQADCYYDGTEWTVVQY